MITVAVVRRVRCTQCGEAFSVVGWTAITLGDCPDCGPAWFTDIENESEGS